MEESMQVISNQVGEILTLCRALTGVFIASIVALLGAGFIFFGYWLHKSVE